MGFIRSQLADVVECEENGENIIFWKWTNREIKKGSKLILKPGQDAIFLFNGRKEGVFTDDGDYDIESQIIPFLSTLKGFKFGFNSGMRAEVLFVNTKEFIVRWGTKGAISIPAPNMPGGIPIRCFGTFTFKIADYDVLIEKIAGVKVRYTVDDVKERIISSVDPLLMSWIVKEGKDMFNLQANSREIANGIREDLDMDLVGIGLTITSFNIQNFSYPEEVQKMQTKVASQAMIGDMNRYTQMVMIDNMGNNSGANMGNQMLQMQMGMVMSQQMMQNMNMSGGMNNAHVIANSNGDTVVAAQVNSGVDSSGDKTPPKFCPNCGKPTNGMKFCGECGFKLV